jgi:hypothetical protein
MVLYKKSMNYWDIPHEADVLTEAQRDEVVSRVVSAFEWRGYKLEVG